MNMKILKKISKNVYILFFLLLVASCNSNSARGGIKQDGALITHDLEYYKSKDNYTINHPFPQAGIINNLGIRRDRRKQDAHIPPTVRPGAEVRSSFASAGCGERRPSHYLHADGSGNRYCHVGLLPHRRHPYRRIRRFQFRRAGRPYSGFQGENPYRL